MWLHTISAGPSSGTASRPHAQPVHGVDQHPGDEAQQELRHQGVDVHRHGGVAQRGDQRTAAAGSGRPAACPAEPATPTTMNSAFRMLLAAITRERCWARALLDQRIQRHDEEAAEHRHQHQVDDSTRQPSRGQEGGDRQPSCAPLAARPAARSDTGRVRTGSCRSNRRAPGRSPPCAAERSHSSEPTPMPTENSASSRVTDRLAPPITSARRPGTGSGTSSRRTRTSEMPMMQLRNTVRLPVREVQVAPGLAERVPVDGQVRRRRRRRHRTRGEVQPISDGDRDIEMNTRWAVAGNGHQRAAEQGAEQDGDEGRRSRPGRCRRPVPRSSSAAAGSRT
jgi:hypothetical protein